MTVDIVQNGLFINNLNKHANPEHSSDAFADQIETRLAALDPNVPSFTYLSLQAVHSPVKPQAKFMDLYRDIYGKIPSLKRTKMLAHITALGKQALETWV